MKKIYLNVESRYPLAKKKIIGFVLDLLIKNRVRHGKLELGISIVGNRKIRELSQKFLGSDEIHEVLSFALEDSQQGASKDRPSGRQGFVSPPDKILRLGDVVVSYPQAVQMAAKEGNLVEDEIIFLIEHGVLHLLGIHHD